MNNTFILALINKYTKGQKNLTQDDFLDIAEGLEEDEVEALLKLLTANGYQIKDESQNRTYCYQNGNLRGLSNEELCKMAQNGCKEAVDVLVINNERLVRKIASRVVGQFGQISLDLDDLYVEGCMGLMEAIKRYDASRETHFSSYACYWIRQAITRAIVNDGFEVRLPVHVFEQVVLVNKCRIRHNGATLSELCNFVNKEHDRQYTCEDIQHLVDYADTYLDTNNISTVVDDTIGDDELLDFMPALDCVEEQVLATILSMDISKMLDDLNEREHAVISMRFGLEGYNSMTLEAIGDLYQVTRERIRQIEAKALRKLALKTRKMGYMAA